MADSVLSSIFSAAKVCYEKYKQVQANKEMCSNLVTRLRACVASLEGASSLQKGGKFKVALDQMYEVTKEIQDYLNEFTNKNIIKKILRAASISEEYQELNTKLSHAAEALNLGINVQSLFNSEQDRIAVQKDMEDLFTRQEEVVRGLVSKGNEDLYRRMRLMIEQKMEELSAGNDGAGIAKEPESPFASLEIPFYELENFKHIASGGYGEVYSAKYRGEEVALKTLLSINRGPTEIASFKRELKIMSGLQSRYIIHFFGACTHPKNLAIVMELMKGGSLYSLLQSDQPLDWAIRIRMAVEIASGLRVLHNCKPTMLHRDLKSMNILLDEHQHCKLADFGLAETKATTMSSGTQGGGGAGTLAWMAPELLLLKPKYSIKSDVYALGMVLWEIAARKLPYAGAPPEVVRSCVTNGEREELPEGADVPRGYNDLIAQCWHHDPAKRPDLNDIIATLTKMCPSNELVIEDMKVSATLVPTPVPPSVPPPKGKQPLPQQISEDITNHGGNIKVIPESASLAARKKYLEEMAAITVDENSLDAVRRHQKIRDILRYEKQEEFMPEGMFATFTYFPTASEEANSYDRLPPEFRSRVSRGEWLQIREDFDDNYECTTYACVLFSVFGIFMIPCIINSRANRIKNEAKWQERLAGRNITVAYKRGFFEPQIVYVFRDTTPET